VAGLRRGRSRLAALIASDLVHPFFAELAKGLSEVLRATHSLVMASTDEEADVERRQVDDLLAGAIVGPWSSSTGESPAGRDTSSGWTISASASSRRSI
jgi:LacI family transcriptional regulator